MRRQVGRWFTVTILGLSILSCLYVFSIPYWRPHLAGPMFCEWDTTFPWGWHRAFYLADQIGTKAFFDKRRNITVVVLDDPFPTVESDRARAIFRLANENVTISQDDENSLVIICEKQVHRFALGNVDSNELRKEVLNSGDNDRILDLIVSRFNGPDKARLMRVRECCDRGEKAIRQK
jgi:hypothetical protein